MCWIISGRELRIPYKEVEAAEQYEVSRWKQYFIDEARIPKKSSKKETVEN